jgi:hypothetical protein
MNERKGKRRGTEEGKGRNGKGERGREAPVIVPGYLSFLFSAVGV